EHHHEQEAATSKTEHAHGTHRLRNETSSAGWLPRMLLPNRRSSGNLGVQLASSSPVRDSHTTLVPSWLRQSSVSPFVFSGLVGRVGATQKMASRAGMNSARIAAALGCPSASPPVCGVHAS